MAAYIAAGIFNERKTALLYYMNLVEISFGSNAHSYAEKEDAERSPNEDRRRTRAREEWLADSKLNY